MQRVGEYLAQMAALSAVVPEIPWGPRWRMPHGINYIHESAHYNSGILVFTDFADAIGHFTDRRNLLADKLASMRQQGIPDEPIARP